LADFFLPLLFAFPRVSFAMLASDATQASQAHSQSGQPLPPSSSALSFLASGGAAPLVAPSSPRSTSFANRSSTSITGGASSSAAAAALSPGAAETAVDHLRQHVTDKFEEIHEILASLAASVSARQQHHSPARSSTVDSSGVVTFPDRSDDSVTTPPHPPWPPLSAIASAQQHELRLDNMESSNFST
jgi:hypothetical protein